MNKISKLPTVNKKKMMDPKKFEALAKRVRKTFEEEEKYLREHTDRYGYLKARGLTLSS